MPSTSIPLVRECTAPDCRFRYPIPNPADDRPLCPLCGGPTVVAAWVDASPPMHAPPSPKAVWPVEVLLDNIRSTYNVGSILRTADGAGIRHVHLAGITPHADNPKVTKTSLGAESSVPWTYHRNGVDAVADLRASGMQIWALDVYANGVLLPVAVQRTMPYTHRGEPVPILLVVGNEKTGIDPAIAAQADQLITLPMQGGKRSLNVAVAFGVAAYFLTHGA